MSGENGSHNGRAMVAVSDGHRKQKAVSDQLTAVG